MPKTGGLSFIVVVFRFFILFFILSSMSLFSFASTDQPSFWQNFWQEKDFESKDSLQNIESEMEGAREPASVEVGESSLSATPAGASPIGGSHGGSYGGGHSGGSKPTRGLFRRPLSRVWLGLDFYAYNLYSVSGSSSAQRSFWSDFYWPLSIAWDFYLSDRWDWSLTISSSHPTSIFWPVKSMDSGLVKNWTHLGFPFTYRWNSRISFLSGIGLGFYHLQGKSGKISLQDGVGDSDFTLPSQSVWSSSWFVEGGGQYDLRPSIRAQTALRIDQVLSSKRSYSLHLRLSYCL